MKTLLILRHAKSSWKETSLADHARPLNKRGKRDAPRLGRWLREEDLVPELILTSPAVRALKTAEIVAEESGYEGEIKLESSFYPGEPADYLEILHGLPDEYQSIMIVGHNPGLEELVEALTGEAIPLPTCALAQIALPVRQWRELDEETQSKLINYWQVKQLG